LIINLYTYNIGNQQCHTYVTRGRKRVKVASVTLYRFTRVSFTAAIISALPTIVDNESVAWYLGFIVFPSLVLFRHCHFNAYDYMNIERRSPFY